MRSVFGTLNRYVVGHIYRVFLFSVLTVLAALSAQSAYAQTLSKVFTPNSIGPGSVSTATFTINNNTGSPVTSVAFTDNLPAAITVADPANASLAGCPSGGTPTLTATAGGGTISFSGGEIGAGVICTITVDVTASTPGSHTNPAVALNWSGGSANSVPTDLTVVTNRPGFAKSFAPNSVFVGGRSTLTFTIDNALNPGPVGNLSFIDNLPAGVEIANPANASTDCVSVGAPATTLTAVPGNSTIELDARGSTFFPGFEVLPIGATCTVAVDVIGTAIGTHINSTQLVADGFFAGFATDALEVTGSPLLITKEFTDDPAAAGGTTTLEFTIQNTDRNFSATGVAFTDDLTTLAPTLAGLTFSSLLSNDCGGSISGAGGTTIGLSGGTLAPEATCTIRTSLSVPAGATPGVYTNTTSTVTGTVDGNPVVGNMASDDLFISAGANLAFTKAFVPGAVNAGDPVTLRFTVENNNAAGSDATAVAFLDELTDGGPGTGFLPFPVAVTLPPTPDPPCGPGSSLALIFIDTDRQGLQLTGGNVASGASCTFDVTVTVPAGLSGGTYTNTTEELTATIGGTTVSGGTASANLTVSGGLNLSFTKEFSGAAVSGGTVDMTFTIENAPGSVVAAQDITFTDDLAALVPAIAGLTANFPPTPNPPCGAGSSLTGSAGDTLLTLMGGTLDPGVSCTFTVTLDVPAAATFGTYTNTTSPLTATPAGGSPTLYPAATADLTVAGLEMSKTFLTNPVLAGGTTVLEYTIENFNTTTSATGLGFTESLFAVGGAVATDPALTNDCGGTATITTIPGLGSFITYAGGSLAASSTCMISFELTIPGTTANGLYLSDQTSLSGMFGATPTNAVAPQVDLEVNSAQLTLTKSFTDDPVGPGDTVTLEFTLENTSAGAASDVDFTDDLGAMLAGTVFDSILFNDCGATVTGTTTSIITVIGGALAVGASCTIRTSNTVPGGGGAGSYTNTTSGVTGIVGGVPVTGDPASDMLNVSTVGTTFSKLFDGPTVAGGTATLSFTITNANTSSVTGLAFTDDLDAVVPGLIATSLPATPCGPGSSITGISLLTFSGGELAASGGTCTFDVDVLVPAGATPGTFPNATSDLLSSGLFSASPATADLTIEPPPTFAKVFAPDNILFGGISTLTFTIDNTASALAASALDFTDNLPAAVTVATPANASTTCTGGTLTAAAGSGVISYTGGTVGAGTSCTVEVDTTSSTAGTHTNTTGDLTSSSGNSSTATDDLVVTDMPPLFSKLFTPDSIQTNALSVLSFTIDNTAAGVDATGLSFVDNLPAGVIVAAGGRVSTSCVGGTLTAAGGSSTISYTGGTVPANATCIVNVEVQGTTAGTHTNVTGDLTSLLGNSGTATDDLMVTDLPPTFAKVFTPDTINAGAISTLVFTIDNTVSTVDATLLSFVDNLPASVTVASPSNASTTCTSGTLTAVSGTAVISYTGGTVAASSTCTVSVDVTSDTAGAHTNLTEDLTSSLGISGRATDILNVNFVLPVFSKQFAPGTIVTGTISTLTFTIDNTGSLVDATALGFTDNMPAAITVATPANASTTCTGGTVTATSGSSTISYSGGTANASASCVVNVDVTSSTLGAHVNLTGDLISSLGNSGTATDTLTVDLPLGTISIVKNTAPAVAGDGTFEFTSTDPDLDAISLTTVGNTATSTPVAKAAGVYTISEDITAGWVLDSIACVGDIDAGSVIDLPNREVAIDIDNGETIVCTFTNIRDAGEVVKQTMEAIMDFMEKRADQMTANQPDLVSRLRDREKPGVAPLEFTGSGTLASSTSRFSTSLHKVKTWHSNLNDEYTSETPTFDIWMHGFFSHTNTTSSKSHLGMVHFGADYLINPDLVVGGIVQLDWASLDSSTTVATTEGFGWMAGPYFVANPWQNIYIDGRVAYGQSYNDINPIGLYTDQFDTDRFLATLQITGDMSFGKLNVNPAAELIYFNERQQTYVDTLGNTIPSQSLEVGRVIFGPQFSYNMVLDNGATLTPTAKFEGIWDFHEKKSGLGTGTIESIGGLRGRVDLGLGYTDPSGVTVQASGFYDGIGRSGFEAVGGKLDIRIPLQRAEQPDGAN